MLIPDAPKIYHIVHVDRLPSVIGDGYLWCDAEVSLHSIGGTTIGMNHIKQRRLARYLRSHPGLHVGDCVPFYFCPRSVMLYVIYKKWDPELFYRGGQDPIIHLEADLAQTVKWADDERLRWAFTDSNAAANESRDWCNLAQLEQINWDAVQARMWSGSDVDPSVRQHKQAEFLIEWRFPWKLVSRIGVYSQQVEMQVRFALRRTDHQPLVEVKREWYY